MSKSEVTHSLNNLEYVSWSFNDGAQLGRKLGLRATNFFSNCGERHYCPTFFQATKVLGNTLLVFIYSSFIFCDILYLSLYSS